MRPFFNSIDLSKVADVASQRELELVELRHIVAAFLSHLSSVEKCILLFVFWYGVSIADAARCQRISRQAAHEALHRGLRKGRDYFCNVPLEGLIG